MGDPRIVWNGNDLDFPHGVSDLDVRPVDQVSRQSTAGAITETLLGGTWFEGRLSIRRFSSRGFFRNLMAWWSWARQGNQWAYAHDRTRTVDTTLDGTATAGTKTIPLASTTGIVAGNEYLVWSADRLTFEPVVVDTISAGVSVDAVDDLLNTYASGDIFRDHRYFPKVVSIDDRRPFRELPSLLVEMDMRFREDRN